MICDVVDHSSQDLEKSHDGQQKCILPGVGRTFNVLGGDEITIKADAEDTDGAFTVIETITPPGAGPPPHMHQREDESFYIVEGEFEFHIGKDTAKVKAGSFVMSPRNIPHSFRNVGADPGKLLIVCQPAGFEKFVEEFATIPPDQPPDLAKMASIGRKYGIEFVSSTRI